MFLPRRMSSERYNDVTDKRIGTWAPTPSSSPARTSARSGILQWGSGCLGAYSRVQQLQDCPEDWGGAHGSNKVRGDRGKGGDHHDGLHHRGGGHYGGVEHGGEEVRDKNHLILHNQSMKCCISY